MKLMQENSTFNSVTCQLLLEKYVTSLGLATSNEPYIQPDELENVEAALSAWPSIRTIVDSTQRTAIYGFLVALTITMKKSVFSDNATQWYDKWRTIFLRQLQEQICISEQEMATFSIVGVQLITQSKMNTEFVCDDFLPFICGGDKSFGTDDTNSVASTSNVNVLDTFIVGLLCDIIKSGQIEDIYDARSRALVMKAFSMLQGYLVREDGAFEFKDVILLETKLLRQIQICRYKVKKMKLESDLLSKHNKKSKTRRWLLTGIATAGGAALIGLTAGLAAPVIGAGLTTALGGIGLGGASAVLGSTGFITVSGVLTGGGFTGYKMAQRTKGIEEFRYEPIEMNHAANVTIFLTGWLTCPEDFHLPFSTVAKNLYGETYTLVYESKVLSELGAGMIEIAGEVVGYATVEVLKTTVLGALMSALAWPATLLRFASVIDNRWAVGLDRAWKAGLLLADSLKTQLQQGRPVTLVGFSLGARAIAYCLLQLSKEGERGHGIIENVFLFGAPIAFTQEEWQHCRSVVAGRLVNGYSTQDWVLGFMYRASNVTLGSIAGLSPIDIPGNAIENVDVTEHVNGHLEYRRNFPILLKKVGFEVTSETFEDVPKKEESSSDT